MSNQKSARTFQCRGCHKEYLAEARNQRYCTHCREAKKRGAESLRNKVCNHCGKERADCYRNICPDCRQAQAAAEKAKEAAKLERINADGGCRQCGGLVTTSRLGHVCDECHEKDLDRRHEEAKRRRLEELHRHVDENARRRRLEYLQEFEKLPIEEKERHLVAGLSWVFAKLAVRRNEEINPEQVPAIDQDRIDTAFRDLMEGFDL